MWSGRDELVGIEPYGIALDSRESRGAPDFCCCWDESAMALREFAEVRVPDSETVTLRLRPKEDAKALMDEDTVARRFSSDTERRN